jgi:hypothetical protein
MRPIERRFWAILLLLPLLLLAGACTPAVEEEEMTEAPEAETESDIEGGQMEDASELAYADTVSGPPPGWEGPVFELSHDYPTTDPGECPESTCGWLGVDVDFDSTEPQQWEGAWVEYMDAIFEYVKEGQSLSPEGWNASVGGETRWFHIPWMAYDPKVGREFVHGFTNERTAYLSDFEGNDTGGAGRNLDFGIHALPIAGGGSTEQGFETWAVGFYNPWGGYAVGGSWGTNGLPIMEGDPSQAAGLPFPEGTVVAKILFTTATPADVPYLEGSPEWQADRHVQTGGCDREVQPVYLVQMDVAVVDERAPTRWVYGTFGYNGTLDSTDVWERLSPLGLQWGNDHGSWPAVERDASEPIHQSVLAPIDIYEHYGCDGRLAGPVDNKMSACMACHGGGYVARPVGSISTMGDNIPPIFGFDGLCEVVSPANANYFANVTYPDEYTGGGYPDTFSTDTSLQMQVAYLQYGIYHTNGEPDACQPSS